MHFTYTLNNTTQLRLLEPRYATDVYALINTNRAHLGRWLDWVDHTQSAADTQAFCRHTLRECAHETGLTVGIWHADRFAGMIGLIGVHHGTQSADIGYWLGEAYQGQGLVTDACRAVIAHAFGVLGLNRIQIRVQPANIRSRAIPNRLGFRHEGTLRQVGEHNGARFDLDVFALLRDAWDGAPQPVTFTAPLADDTGMRLLLPHDAGAVYALIAQNRHHLRWMPFLEHTHSESDIRNFIRRTLHALSDDTGIHAAVIHQGSLAGIIGADAVDTSPHRVEMGYWLGEAFQGKGLMTQAGQAMLTHLFTVAGRHRVDIRCDIHNTRSRALAERLGFVHEGTTRQADRIGGAFVDMHRFGLLRSDWDALNRHQSTVDP